MVLGLGLVVIEGHGAKEVDILPLSQMKYPNSTRKLFY